MSMGSRYQRAVQRIVESRAAACIAELQAEMAQAEAAIEAAEAEHDCINTELAAANSALHRALAQRIALEQSGAPDEVATSSVIARLDDIAPDAGNIVPAKHSAPILCEIVPTTRPALPHKGIR